MERTNKLYINKLHRFLGHSSEKALACKKRLKYVSIES